MMPKEKIYEIPESMKKNALINVKEYEEIYRKSIKDPQKFWATEAKKYLSWQSDWREVSRSDFTGSGFLMYFSERNPPRSVPYVSRFMLCFWQNGTILTSAL